MFGKFLNKLNTVLDDARTKNQHDLIENTHNQTHNIHLHYNLHRKHSKLANRTRNMVQYCRKNNLVDMVVAEDGCVMKLIPSYPTTDHCFLGKEKNETYKYIYKYTYIKYMVDGKKST